MHRVASRPFDCYVALIRLIIYCLAAPFGLLAQRAGIDFVGSWRAACVIAHVANKLESASQRYSMQRLAASAPALPIVDLVLPGSV